MRIRRSALLVIIAGLFVWVDSAFPQVGVVQKIVSVQGAELYSNYDWIAKMKYGFRDRISPWLRSEKGILLLCG